jgi:4-hydroxy-tetrahydrodipicolinate synthase
MGGISFRGSIVAIVTPFTAKGRVDGRKLQELVRWHIQEGTEGIVCSGTTGESTTLSESDRKKVLQLCLESAEKKIPIIAGTGTCDTKQSVRLTEDAQKGGADGCLVITPYYNKPSQRGCVLHFQEISRVGLPFIVYNNPGRTIVQLQPETIAAIGQMPHAAAIKESTNDVAFLGKIRALTSLPILAGEDALTCAMLQAGAVGAISVVANIIPAPWKKMIQLALNGDWVQAKSISDRFLPLCQALFRETNPQCVKYALSLMGKCSKILRLPLVEPNEAAQEEIRRTLLNLSLPFYQHSTSTKGV